MAVRRGRFVAFAATLSLAALVATAAIASPAVAAPPEGKGKGKTSASAATVSGVSVEAEGSDYAVLGDISNSSKTEIRIVAASADGGATAQLLDDTTGAETVLVVSARSTLSLSRTGDYIKLSSLPDPLPADVIITLEFEDGSTLDFIVPMPVPPPPPPPAPLAESIGVSGASVEPAGSDYAVLGDITNSSTEPITISTASTDPATGTAELYDSTADAVTEFEIPGRDGAVDGTLSLTLTGYYIRLRDLPTPLPENVTITLTFSDGSTDELTVPIPATPPPPPPTPSVSVMAAVGDSITVAYDANGYGSYPQYSWATGTSTTVNSHLLRLQSTLQSSVTATNLAVVGASSADLASQIDSAVDADADYLTVEIGANDACTSTVAGMTSVADYDQRIRTALATFHEGRPDAEIFVASIPNIYQMWNVSKDKFGARWIWAIAGICQSMLANPTSTSQADEARRLAVQQRVDDYNDALAAACTPAVNCTFDGFAVADYVFSSKDVSTSDYFHPSVEGQRVLAQITWPLSPFASGG